MTINIASFLYLVSGILFILALRGLSHPTTSRQGNTYGMIGLPDMRPSSFAKAMTEPVKVMAPMATPSAISNSDSLWMWPFSRMPTAWGA